MHIRREVFASLQISGGDGLGPYGKEGVGRVGGKVSVNHVDVWLMAFITQQRSGMFRFGRR